MVRLRIPSLALGFTLIAASIALAQPEVDNLIQRSTDSIRRDDLAGAEQAYTKLSAMSGQAHVTGIIGLAGVLKAKQKHTEAVQLLRYEASQSGNPEYSTIAGLFLFQKGLRDDASKELAPVLQKMRNGEKFTGSTLLTLALVEQRLGDLESALDAAHHAAEVLRTEGDRRWTSAGLLAADILEDSGQGIAAEMEFEFLVDAAPDDASVLNNYAYHFAVVNKKMAAALTYSKRSLEILPGNPPLLDTLGLIYIKMGRFEDAVPVLAQSWRARPDNTVVRNHFAQALAKRPNPSKLLQDLLENLRAEPTPTNTQEIFRLLTAIGQ